MPNTYGLNRSLGVATAAIAVVSLLSSGAVLITLNQLRTATEARGHATQVIRTVDASLVAMLNQETGLRGYLLTGRADSLDPYREGRKAFDRTIADLRALLGSDPVQGERLVEAERSARGWQSDVGEATVRRMTDPITRASAVVLESQGEGKRYFDAFREKLAAIQATEAYALAVQDGVLASAERNASIALAAATLLTLLICAAIGLALNRLIVTPLVQLADAMRRLAQRDLEVAVPGTRQRNEVGAMARAVEVFKAGMIELDRTSLLRATADTLPALVGYIDVQRRVGFLNGEFGRWFDLQVDDVSEVYGRPLSQVFSGASFPGAGQELEAAFAGAERRFEHRLARRGAGRRQVEAVYRPHRASDGSVLGVVTLLTDITERKRMELRLAQQGRDLLRSNEELEQFAYVASHDLKAPLRGIENLVSWIEEDMEEMLTGDTRINMDLLKSRVRRLESLLDDLLAYSRAGRNDATVDTIDTRVLVQELAALVSPPEGFQIEADAGLPTIEAARAPLTQALQNLIGNAIKHHDHPATGHIWVAARPTGAMIAFTVTDDGPGIPEQFRERVFGMFQTLRPRDEVEGSGMGLAIVKKLVERQGGTVWLSEGRDDRGLTVHFTWPVGVAQGSTDGTNRELAAG
jgi:PAS domain S-box-containing protein